MKKKKKAKKSQTAKKNKMRDEAANDESNAIHSDKYDPHGIVFPFMICENETIK